MNEEIPLKINGAYLIEENVMGYKNIYKINVWNVTETSYEIKFEHAEKPYWLTKKDFECKYIVIEDISNYMLNNQSEILNNYKNDAFNAFNSVFIKSNLNKKWKLLLKKKINLNQMQNF